MMPDYSYGRGDVNDLSRFSGVDACNTALGVLVFSASMNLGQSWAAMLTLFGCMCTILFYERWTMY